MRCSGLGLTLNSEIVFRVMVEGGCANTSRFRAWRDVMLTSTVPSELAGRPHPTDSTNEFGIGLH